ncbi:MAG TPA: sialidase family protein [bacterium]|nr:sialidase family protein [bacterium]
MTRLCTVVSVWLAVMMAGVAAVGAESVLESADVFVSGRGGYPVYRIPAMVVTERGTVLAFCEGRKTGIADHGNIDIVFRRSEDGAKTWGPLQVIEGRGFQTWGNPAPVEDRDTGRVWLLFTRNNVGVWVTSSDDDGMSWAEPREITAEVKADDWGWYATGPGHAVQLASGRLLVPCDHGESDGMHSHVIYSDDHGSSWRRGGSLPAGTDESMAVEVGSRVYLTIRNMFGKQRRAYAWSDDGGVTWSAAKIDESLTDPTCQASVLGLGPERVLFLNPASARRENMAIRVSYDGAESWSGPRTIHAGPAAYSDLAILPDGSVGALFENGKHWPYHKITFVRLDMVRVLNGKAEGSQ